MTDQRNLERRLSTLETAFKRYLQADSRPRLILPTSDFQIVEYVIDSLSTKGSGPYTGLIAASATVKGVLCGLGATLIEESIEVIDHSGCIFDEATMDGYTGWAVSNMEYLSLDAGAANGEMTPCHYAAFNRCCAPDSGTYGSLV